MRSAAGRFDEVVGIVLYVVNFRSLGMIGHNEEEFPVERLYVNSNGEITSITHDIRFDTLASGANVVIDLHLASALWL